MVADLSMPHRRSVEKFYRTSAVEYLFAEPMENRIMSGVPAGTEIVRAFLPTKDFDLSRHFYEALGFVKVLDGEVAIFNAGSGGFILQRHFQKDWAANCMMQLMVDDLDAWWAHLESLELPGRFGVPPPKSPEMQPWGLRVAYVVDPAGVLWHVAQRREGAKQDR